MKPSRTSAGRAARYTGRHTVSIDVDTSALNDIIAGLEDDVATAIRPAAQAGAEVLYRAVLSNVSAIGRKTGNLYASIYQNYAQDKSTEQRAEYHISWRTANTGLPRAPHGHLVEYGYWQKYKVYLGRDGHWYTDKKAPLPTPIRVAGKAFIRNAAARSGEALDAAEKRFFEELKK